MFYGDAVFNRPLAIPKVIWSNLDMGNPFERPHEEPLSEDEERTRDAAITRKAPEIAFEELQETLKAVRNTEGLERALADYNAAIGVPSPVEDLGARNLGVRTLELIIAEGTAQIRFDGKDHADYVITEPAPFREGMRVTVERSSGAREDDWTVMYSWVKLGADGSRTRYVRCHDKGMTVQRDVEDKDLKRWTGIGEPGTSF